MPANATREGIGIVVNGERREAAAGATLGSYLRGLGLDPDLVVVERNGGIVPRGSFDATELAPGDRLEVVHFVGGG